MRPTKQDIVEQLQRDILSLQGYKKLVGNHRPDIGLGAVEKAFPQSIFPINAVHEFISNTMEESAATNGFLSGIVSRIIQQDRTCLWISNKRTVFPPALKLFGINPEQVVFIDLQYQRDVLWAIEEALKCESLSAVVGELKDLSFTESRRLQLAVEQSGVTGIIHRHNPKAANTVACLTRWKIKPVATVLDGKMPGVGFPRWHVQLLKVRNGKPGAWILEWVNNGFRHVIPNTFTISRTNTRQTG